MIMAGALLLAGCGGGGGSAKSGKVSGETFSTDNFSVLIPKGWRAIRATDPFENGKLREDMVYINKGAKSDIAIFSTPGVVVLYAPNAMTHPPKSFYDDTADITPFTAGKYAFEGFSGKFSGKPLIVFWTTNAKEYFQITINAEIDGKKIALDDADVQAIIASVTLVEK